jgi:hypothetical protein
MALSVGPAPSYSGVGRLGRRLTPVFLSGFVVTPIFIGAAIYTLWRSKSLLVFTWYRWAGLEAPVMLMRRDVASFRHFLPGVIVYSLPDALWVYSFTVLLGYIWSGQTPCWERRFWTFLPVSLGIGGEFGQLLRLVPGTFDWADVAAYAGAWLSASLSLLIFSRLAGRRANDWNAQK